MFNELTPQIEYLQSQGAVVLLKWDGERQSNRCSVVITRKATNYLFRCDTDDMAAALREAFAHYKDKHLHAR